MPSKNYKKEFLDARSRIFSEKQPALNSFKFSVQYSLLVEEYIRRILEDEEIEFAITSAGSFSRRELSPYSDIDLMFILSASEGQENKIRNIVTELWDAGIEVSQTIREYKDIDYFIKEDLHTFTQFFETRFLLGSETVYKDWNRILLESLNSETQRRLILKFFDDIKIRYIKYGNSAKILEPNIKFSAGGLRDFQAVEWMYSIINKTLLTSQEELTQAENFIRILSDQGISQPKERKRLLESYRLILYTRNALHLISGSKTDRLEYSNQSRIAKLAGFDDENSILPFMKKYFEASNTIHRFSKTMIRKFEEEISKSASEILSFELDNDFRFKESKIYVTDKKTLTLSEILRAFYYLGFYPNSQFDESLRSLIIESIHEYEETGPHEPESSVFFREILRLPSNLGNILFKMNELGVLGAFLPEFKELRGFFQPGVYHCYTADEHTLVAIRNLEELQGKESHLGKIYGRIKDKDLIILAILFHDIAKPISVTGHEIIGADFASLIMNRLGYAEEEIELVKLLVRNHLLMEQIAFRRNLNDPTTLNNFTAFFTSPKELDYLYLLTYADLSAVNPAIWTEWKSDLLYELYRKSRLMLEDQISGEEFLYQETLEVISAMEGFSDSHVQEHIDSINDLGYLHHFSEDEINSHLEEIKKGSNISSFIKNVKEFTNITIITRDSPSLLSKLCGVLSINDLNIHDAKIFTRKDGIVIDSFNVTAFRTGTLVDPLKFEKIQKDLELALGDELKINKEFNLSKAKWWRLENKIFKRKGKVKVDFEEHDKYTIIDIFSPDRIGLLYQITKKMSELGILIYFAKIATKADDVVDSFYTLDRNGRKILSADYELIKQEITEAIKQIL